MKTTELDREIRRRYHQIMWRTNNKKAYKDIECEFTWNEFYKFAIDSGYFLGARTHRPDRNGNYEPGNIVWVNAEEHHRISGLEKRILDDESVRGIRKLRREGMTTRKIAEVFDISQSLSWQITAGKAYQDVPH